MRDPMGAIVTKIQSILNGVKWGESSSMANAMEQMKSVPEHELHYYLVLRETLQATSVPTRQGITLAQMEDERRKQEREERLLKRTTTNSAMMGIAGVVIGVVLTGAISVALAVYFNDNDVRIVAMPEIRIFSSADAPTPKMIDRQPEPQGKSKAH